MSARPPATGVALVAGVPSGVAVGSSTGVPVAHAVRPAIEPAAATPTRAVAHATAAVVAPHVAHGVSIAHAVPVSATSVAAVSAHATPVKAVVATAAAAHTSSMAVALPVVAKSVHAHAHAAPLSHAVGVVAASVHSPARNGQVTRAAHAATPSATAFTNVTAALAISAPPSPQRPHTNGAASSSNSPATATVAHSAHSHTHTASSSSSSSSHTLAVPASQHAVLARPAPTSALDTKVVMATVLESGPPTPVRSTPVASRTVSPLPLALPVARSQPVSPMPKQHVVTATVVEEGPSGQPRAARPATPQPGQKVVAATVIPPPAAQQRPVMATTVQARVATQLAGHAAAATVASAVHVPSFAHANRGRKRGHGKSASVAPSTSASSSSSRSKLSTPDPLSAVSEGASVTRCICGSIEDDGFMICCEACAAWQHGDCVGLDPDNVPEEYYCDLCDPESDIHRARAERIAAAAAQTDGKRKRRKRGHMSLGKKKGRRASRTNTARDDHDDDDDEDEAMSGSDSQGSYSSSGEEEDAGEEVDGDATASPSVGIGEYASSPASAAQPSPIYGSTSEPSSMPSPGGTMVIVSSLPPSVDCTPAASPTGETRLRSLIFTMEQLANGQMTSPISTSAGFSLSQMNQVKFSYPVPGEDAATDAKNNGTQVHQVAMSPLVLHRQVSENTAAAAMTVAGISSEHASASPPTSQVKLEPFSPVLPPSMVAVTQKGSAENFTFIPIASSSDTLAYRAHRAAMQQQQVKTEQTVAAGAAIAPDATPTVTTGAAPTVAVATSPTNAAGLVGLLSPNTHAAVVSLTSVRNRMRATETKTETKDATSNIAGGIISPTR